MWSLQTAPALLFHPSSLLPSWSIFPLSLIAPSESARPHRIVPAAVPCGCALRSAPFGCVPITMPSPSSSPLLLVRPVSSRHVSTLPAFPGVLPSQRPRTLPSLPDCRCPRDYWLIFYARVKGRGGAMLMLGTNRTTSSQTPAAAIYRATIPIDATCSTIRSTRAYNISHAPIHIFLRTSHAPLSLPRL